MSYPQRIVVTNSIFEHRVEPTSNILRILNPAKYPSDTEVPISPPKASTVSSFVAANSSTTSLGSWIRKAGMTNLTALCPRTSERYPIQRKHACKSEYLNLSKAIFHWPTKCRHAGEAFSTLNPWASTSTRFSTYPNGATPRLLYRVICLFLLLLANPP